jgi:hypothetical protein
VKGVASKGVRLGNWLSVQQAQKLLNAPEPTTANGLRDRAILAVLLGCGLRRSEVAALTVGHVQQRDGAGASWIFAGSMAACGQCRCQIGLRWGSMRGLGPPASLTATSSGP